MEFLELNRGLAVPDLDVFYQLDFKHEQASFHGIKSLEGKSLTR